MSALATIARLMAILIAVLAAIDPAITSMRRTKPEIAVINASRQDSALARQVSDRPGVSRLAAPVASERSADSAIVRAPWRP